MEADGLGEVFLERLPIHLVPTAIQMFPVGGRESGVIKN
jgi:hypothetical protein